MTPRMDLAADVCTLGQLREKISKSKAEKDRLSVHDEQWFEQQLHKGTMQRILDGKQKEIQALRNELIAFHQEKKPSSGAREHRGIKED